MRTAIAASILIAAGAARAAVVPDFQQPTLGKIADRMHAMAVQVIASGGGENINVASGVLAGDGIVLTDLRALLVDAAGGGVVPSSEIAVVTAKGAFAARIVAVALDADVAVLELPPAARGFEGPPLAEGSAAAGDELLAIRASIQGTALNFEAISFSIGQTEGEAQSTPALPNTFAGAPVFDGRGALVGLLVNPAEQRGLLVPSVRLRQILDRVRAADPKVDDHI
jgi:hypothetical protein